MQQHIGVSLPASLAHLVEQADEQKEDQIMIRLNQILETLNDTDSRKEFLLEEVKQQKLSPIDDNNYLLFLDKLADKDDSFMRNMMIKIRRNSRTYIPYVIREPPKVIDEEQVYHEEIKDTYRTISNLNSLKHRDSVRTVKLSISSKEDKEKVRDIIKNGVPNEIYELLFLTLVKASDKEFIRNEIISAREVPFVSSKYEKWLSIFTDAKSPSEIERVKTKLIKYRKRAQSEGSVHTNYYVE